MHCSTRGIHHCSVLLCKRGSQLALCQCNCLSGHLLFMQLCSDATLKLCSTGPVKLLSHFSVLLCKRGSQHALRQCNYTCEHLLFTQLCNYRTPMHNSTGQGRMHSPLLSAAMQKRLTACIMSIQFHLWTFDVHTTLY